ncbi:MAG: ribbon-helix-helix protein, CopG family [Candidatus Wallbacteria bacterium]|nr:ribbon-helix-helix protein, CopG family [Candidatus Wallbacteria bacterium]
MRRLTLSLPDEVVEEADRLARRSGQTRSGFVGQVLQGHLAQGRKRLLEKQLAEGYREMASESLKLSRVFDAAQEEALRAQDAGADDELEW